METYVRLDKSVNCYVADVNVKVGKGIKLRVETDILIKKDEEEYNLLEILKKLESENKKLESRIRELEKTVSEIRLSPDLPEGKAMMAAAKQDFYQYYTYT